MQVPIDQDGVIVVVTVSATGCMSTRGGNGWRAVRVLCAPPAPTGLYGMLTATAVRNCTVPR